MTTRNYNTVKNNSAASSIKEKKIINNSRKSKDKEKVCTMKSKAKKSVKHILLIIIVYIIDFLKIYWMIRKRKI